MKALRSIVRHWLRGLEVPPSAIERVVETLRAGEPLHRDDVRWLVRHASRDSRMALWLMVLLCAVVLVATWTPGMSFVVVKLLFLSIMLAPPLGFWLSAVYSARAMVTRGRVVADVPIANVRAAIGGQGGSTVWSAEVMVPGPERSRVTFSWAEGRECSLRDGDTVTVMLESGKPRVALALNPSIGVATAKCRRG